MVSAASPAASLSCGDLVERGALHAALELDEGHQEAPHEPAQPLHALEDALAGALAPALHDDLAIARVERGDDPLGRQLAQHLGAGRRAQHHAVGAAVEPGQRGLGRADAPADAAARPGQQLLEERAVVALAARAVQVDHGDLAGQGEAARDGARVAGVDLELLAADELDGLAGLDVNRWDDHGVKAPRGARAQECARAGRPRPGPA